MKVIMVMSGGPEAPIIFGDLKKDSRVVYLEHPLISLSSKILTVFRKLHLATRLNKYFRLPFKGIWNSTLSLDTVVNNQEHCKVLFINTSIVKYDIGYLQALKNKKNVEYYLYMLDSVNSAQGKNVAKYLKSDLFRQIYSFDVGDCKQYGFKYFVQPLSAFEKRDLKQEVVYDMYFLGRSKGRLDTLLSIKQLFSSLKLLFKVIPATNQEKSRVVQENCFSEYISYQENVENILKSNVILEIVQENQRGNTLRFQEAILYNKKLLTNNVTVKETPFYNEQYIRYFHSLEDIDMDWVQKKEEVRHDYNGEFSPSKLIDLIIHDV